MVVILTLPLAAGCWRGCDAAPAEPEREGCGDHDPAPWPWQTPDQGLWGEDPKLAPGFCYTQERRAPKMPDADAYLRKLGYQTEASLAEALLICEVEIYSRNGAPPSFYSYKLGEPPAGRPTCSADWDLLNAPD